jgi:hypothetical protein
MLVRTTGTLTDAGSFENLLAVVQTIDPSSERVVVMELFDVDDVDSALARFAELEPPPA